MHTVLFRLIGSSASMGVNPPQIGKQVFVCPFGDRCRTFGAASPDMHKIWLKISLASPNIENFSLDREEAQNCKHCKCKFACWFCSKNNHIDDENKCYKFSHCGQEMPGENPRRLESLKKNLLILESFNPPRGSSQWHVEQGRHRKLWNSAVSDGALKLRQHPPPQHTHGFLMPMGFGSNIWHWAAGQHNKMCGMKNALTLYYAHLVMVWNYSLIAVISIGEIMITGPTQPRSKKSGGSVSCDVCSPTVYHWYFPLYGMMVFNAIKYHGRKVNTITERWETENEEGKKTWKSEWK